MNSEKTSGAQTEAPSEAGRGSERRYEPPRIVSKRSVERVTLLSSNGSIGEGSIVGGQ